MRRVLSVLLILCLSVGILCVPTIAATQDYTLDASSGAVATASGFAGTVTRNNDGTYTATYTGSALNNGRFYVLLSVTAKIENGAYKYEAISEDSIQYIDQTIAKVEAENNSVSFANFIPKSLGKDQVLLLGGVFNGADSPVPLGVILKQGVEVSGWVKTYNPKVAATVEFYESGTYKTYIEDVDDTYSNKILALKTSKTPVASGTSATKVTTVAEPVGFTVEGIEANKKYDVRISKTSHTDYWICGYQVSDVGGSMNTDSTPYVMRGGDITGDGFVNPSDVAKVIATSTFLKSCGEAGVNTAADLNGDGFVNPTDLNVIINSNNFMLGEVVVDVG